MSETIKVLINEDGVTAREVNRFEYPNHATPGWPHARKLWQDQERILRTFTIEGRNGFPNSIHTAEILDKEKLIIRIL